MSTTTPTPLRIAILINTPPDTAFWHDVRKCYQDSFLAVAPTAQIDMYDPVFECRFPRPADYDLVVLTGGKADASSSEPWVLGVLEFLRTAAKEAPQTKILGICWGHQALSRALGGVVRAVPSGPIAGLEDVRLTEAGRKFFACDENTTSYRLPEFHVREVAQPGDGFIHLAENHEMFVNQQNTVLSFQAHPEIEAEMAKQLLLEEDDVYNGRLSQQELEGHLTRLERPTDGVRVLKRVVEWARE
ncbi:copper/iron-regulated glutamine amidotransferase [Aspergillus uvarum CBS 121591]|uniref:Copper/iron-regulated glutamine amidotransferase n=1 Tax=Aspergillus uvarum CBS 121591 TaxID=1448315 RepID=A0A319BZB2_9EURO|nr:copper/iron-regulated glutamine amidotransferase [Aspergillus uvarum CBS 121591]PYH76820.1 copper/iron-regulated glutamine amidotransferase [Aspergillus uvarum CBS 121591]